LIISLKLILFLSSLNIISLHQEVSVNIISLHQEVSVNIISLHQELSVNIISLQQEVRGVFVIKAAVEM
jgi:hypothetical protein